MESMVKKGISYLILSSLLLVNAASCLDPDENQHPSIPRPSSGPSCNCCSGEPISALDQETAPAESSFRQVYTSAMSDLLHSLKINYQNGLLYLFDTHDKTLRIHDLSSSGTDQPDSFYFSQDVTSVYPLSPQKFLFKIGKKKKRKLCVLDLNNPDTIEFLARKEHRKEHKSHRLSYVESSSDVLKEGDAIFFKSEAFDKKGKPCAPNDKKMRTSHTQLFSVNVEEGKTKLIASFPLFSEAVYKESDDSYIIAGPVNSRTLTLQKFSPSSTYCSPFLTVNEFISYEVALENSFIPCQDSLVFLSPQENTKGVFTPFICKEGISRPLLSEGERKTLSADVTTFIPDSTGRLIAYAEDGLRLDWKLPQDCEEEYANLPSLLNHLQKTRECNLYYTDGSPETHMVFKEIGPNGSYRILVLSENNMENGEGQEKKRHFSYKWIDLRDEYREDKDITFLPSILCNVPVLTETYTSRDGALIPVYVVRPPMMPTATPGIIHIHGGPQSRDQWDHSSLNDARYLALLGYTSVLPQYRGSQGFGEEHFKGGYRKHLTTVPEDIIDAALWAETQGYINRDQTVVMGESYGAFITPIILAYKKEEFPFRGGIAFAGFYDVEKNLRHDCGEVSPDVVAEALGWGNWKNAADRQEMHEASPIIFASRLHQPILLIHGIKDDSCSYEQAQLMSNALKKAKVSQAFIRFNKEGHTIGHETHPFYLALIERFLHEVLGGNFEPLSPQEKKSKSKLMRVVRDTTGFFKGFK